MQPQMVDSYHFWDGKVTEDLWWAPHVQGFRQLSPYHEPLISIHEKQPANVRRIENAAMSRAMAINVPHYLLYLQSRVTDLGARIIKARLSTDSGFANALSAAETLILIQGRPRPDVFVNATGLGAFKLCGDYAMFPVRGQTVLVKGEAEAIRTRLGEGYGHYCIPRRGSGTTILGGIKQAGNWSGVPDPETTKVILERCGYMVPELQTGEDGGFEVLSMQCGLRPGRTGGVRIEREVVGGGRRVVHAYGHAGAGYQNSIGCAREVVGLVEASLDQEKIAAKL
jgi:D-amino-acid oxidase